MKAIETTYAGCRFRSRLEARWAVVFDHLGLPWEYEPAGYEVDDGHGEPDSRHRYLPDFFLGHPYNLWVEVKGRWTAKDLTKVVAASTQGGLPLWPDGPLDYPRCNRRRVLMLSDIPRGEAWHWATYFHKGYVEFDAVQLLSLIKWPGQPGSIPIDPIALEPALIGGRYLDSITVDDRPDMEWIAHYLNRHPTFVSFPVEYRFPAYDAGRAARFEHGAHG